MQDTLIQIDHLSKSFRLKGSKVSALEDINLSIRRGEIFGIIGMSGAGKSTLVRCINYLERPTAGDVVFDGRPLGSLSAAELRQVRQQMGMIFQQFNLLMQRTTLDNVCFPLEITGVPRRDAKQRAMKLLEIVGLSNRAEAYPAQLSGGQKQRVAIARALATNPQVLLCDEATSALDPQTTRSILSLLKQLNRDLGITVILITHEMQVIQEICQRVAIIADHKIAEVGTVADIFTHPGTEATRALIYRDKPDAIFKPKAGRQLRIVFDGSSSFEPVVSQLVLDLKEPVNILFADMKDIDGVAYGEMILQVQKDADVARMCQYLIAHGVQVEEVGHHV